VLSWRQRVVLARDVAYAMNFLHHKGYIHRYDAYIPDSKSGAEWRVSCVADTSRWRRPNTRSRDGIPRDLKPDNVLITEHGRAKVCDLVRTRATRDNNAVIAHHGVTPLLRYWANPLRLQGFARASKKASSYMTIAGSVRCLPRSPVVVCGSPSPPLCTATCNRMTTWHRKY
jgi:serine/threonine protein kinase